MKQHSIDRLRLSNCFLAILACCSLSNTAFAETDASPPWLVNEPIVSVRRELYRKQQHPQWGIWCKMFMAGPGLERIEIVSEEAGSDLWVNLRSRVSNDNGRTWSDWQPRPNNLVDYKGVTVWEGEDMTMPVYDQRAGVLIQPWLRQIRQGKLFHNFTYYRLSHDHGRTWSEPRQLKYEDGPDFNPHDPLNAKFLGRNEAYQGQKFLVHSNGTLVYGVGHANAPDDPLNDRRPWRMGAVTFIGRWNAKGEDYQWTVGDHISISPALSSRGFQEIDLAELEGGRVLFVCRGSNTQQTPGRKWYSVSNDGGRTLSPIAEWRYDDGSQFYSPSSLHRLFRHQGNGKLYWIGNICPKPPSANFPRFPLVIAEVDETIPALKRNTVTVVADRMEGQPESVQYSNFSLLENPADHTVELLISDLGAHKDWYADCYKYTLEFR